jgi:hypothetical protein
MISLDKAKSLMKGPDYMEEMVMETLKASDLSLIPEDTEVDFDDDELLEAFQIAQSQIHLKNYRLANSVLLFCHRLLKERYE